MTKDIVISPRRKTMLDILLAFCFALLTFLVVIVICCVLINGGDE